MSDTERMREAICDDLYAALRDMAQYPLGKHRKALLAAINALSALAVPEQAPAHPFGCVECEQALGEMRARWLAAECRAVPEQAPETPGGIVFNLGPLLDEWDALPNDVRHDEELEGVRRWMQNVSEAAEEGRLYAAPAALPDGKDAEREVIDAARVLVNSRINAANVDRIITALAMYDAAIQAQTEGERAQSPASASAVPQCNVAAANQG